METRLDRKQLFEWWAPAEGVWSAWAKPVAFSAVALGAVPERLTERNLEWVPRDGGTAMVVDLAGAEAVYVGLALVFAGYRPVPVFNASSGPSAVVPMQEISEALWQGAAVLKEARLAGDAPPAFLLDSRRLGRGRAAMTGFDNRWLTFPQDFPSANLLQSRGIRRVIVISDGAKGILYDLTHVLLRWREAGISVEEGEWGGETRPAALAKPRWYRRCWWMALAMAGLRRNSAGGFGAVVPEAASGGGGWG
ncbi:MAG TPA: hypothetical protein VM008_11590 [Phycisphaerae bacterium]|nr:hypothetical protein [Phycisphaerae bacterium]